MKTQKIQKQFKRREVKFILDKETFAQFEQELSQYMVEDQFANRPSVMSILTMMILT